MQNRDLEFAQLLTQILLELRMSGSRVADNLGVHRATVSRWASGKREPDADSVLDLSFALRDYFNHFAENHERWQSHLFEIHSRMRTEEWKEDRPLTREALVDLIASRQASFRAGKESD